MDRPLATRRTFEICGHRPAGAHPRRHAAGGDPMHGLVRGQAVEQAAVPFLEEFL